VTKWALVSDFDGTASIKDVGSAMVRHFVGPNCWQEVDASISNRQITAKDAYEIVVGKMHVSDRELTEFVLSFELDPHFKTAATLFASLGLPVLILSDGYDYYIDRILKRCGLDWVPRFANELKIDNQTANPSFPHHGLLNCYRCGNCKTYHLQQLRTQDYKIIYFGDGHTDRCAAKHADIIFAKDYLAHYLTKKGIAFTPFTSYGDALPKLEQYINHCR
jgi:2-hydroxy-3-keto-5-methylthiopentenyl-1-phosphate phosphatase